MRVNWYTFVLIDYLHSWGDCVSIYVCIFNLHQFPYNRWDRALHDSTKHPWNTKQNTECVCVCVLVCRGKKKKVYACAQKNITGVLEGLDRAVHCAPWLWTYDFYCQTVWIYTNAWMYIYTCVCVSNACMYVYTCACVYVYVYEYVHLYVCVYLCVRACVCASGVSIILMQIYGSAVESATHALYIYIHLCICKWMRVSCR